MEYPRHYFEDEVREGFYVMGMMKRVWAAQLEVLSEIDKVCRKHNIKWFADCGTLLGAVRHGGYIPWDDDMDICMLRDDYERFLKVAQDELPEEYIVFNCHFEEFFDLYISRVTNGHGLNFDKDFLNKYHECYLPIGIDVFPLDYLSGNEDYEEARYELCREMFIASDNVSEDSEDIDDYLGMLRDTEKVLKKKYDESRSLRQRYFEATDDAFSVVPPEDAVAAVLMPYWVKDRSHRYKLSNFRGTINVPFEYSEVPVPIEYDSVCKVEYGDYMRPVKAGGVHDYPFFEKMEGRLQELVNHYYLKYVFDPEHLKNEERKNANGVKKQVQGFLQVAQEAHNMVAVSLQGGQPDACLELLSMCQESAINIGNLIEKAYGEGVHAVTALENYCEGVYELYNAIAGGEFGADDAHGVAGFLDGIYNELGNVLKQEIIDRKEMVFIAYRADYWDAYDSMWEKAVSSGEYDVHVIPVPYYKKTAMGGYADEYYEADEFPEKLKVLDYRDYDIALRHPDIIVTQQPYDECNYTIGIKQDYYSANLKKHTEQLIYVAPFILDEIDDKGGKAWKTMEYFCTVPGVVHPDKVIVQSESMRQAYIDKLTEFTGEEYRKVWEDKIDGSGVPLADALLKKQQDAKKSDLIDKLPEEWKKIITKPDGSLKKIVLYNLSAASLAQYGDKAISKLNSVLATFKENQEDIALIWHANPHIKKTLKRTALVMRDKYVKAVENYILEGWGIFTETNDSSTLIRLADAFYGDGGNEPHKMRLLKKPVMLQNIELI